MTMSQAEVQALFRQFGSPLAQYASTSPDRQELAEMLITNLWSAMIAGPQVEEETWSVLKTKAHLSDEHLEPIREVYYQQMKPTVSEEQLAALRLRYKAHENV
jgi:predicted nucleic acid-binding protein